MDDLLDGLNEAQRAAVTSPADVLQVLAPPGSGKTKTLTARVAYLIAHHRLDPRNIIVCTFTVKAAREMKHRVEGFLGSEKADQLNLGTFHSICRRLLFKYGDRIGLGKNFGVADSGDSMSIVNRLIKEKHKTINANVARSRISKKKCGGGTMVDVWKQNGTYDKVPQSAKEYEQEFDVIFEEYEQALKEQNLLDFDDLLLRCADLLRQHPHCVSRIQAVLIDEFQDTSNIQYDLMRLFAQARKVVTIVGDPDQSIYGWRAAEIENLNKMRLDYLDVTVINLEENYRSSGCILLSAQALIEQDHSRHDKALMPTHSAGERPVMRQLLNAFEEADWIVSEIKRCKALTGGLFGYQDFAILFRSIFLSRLVERSLSLNGIPYRMIAGLRFFDRAEVKLVLDYLRCIDNLKHGEALARIINNPPRGIGQLTVDRLWAVTEERSCDLWDAIKWEVSHGAKLTGAQSRSVGNFVSLIKEARRKLRDDKKLPLSGFVEWLIGRLKLYEHLKAKHPVEKDHIAKIENVKELIAHAETFMHDPLYVETFAGNVRADEDGEDGDEDNEEENEEEHPTENMLSHFLANIALTTDAKPEQNEEEKEGRVTLATMHAAKGLEWPVVFVPAAYEGSIPHSRSEDTDEERRLLYVAMTRAQALLYISSPGKNTYEEHVGLSGFLQEHEVGATICNRGPSFSHDLVRELAKILRRESLSLDIETGRKKAENLEDDVFADKTDMLPRQTHAVQRYETIDLGDGEEMTWTQSPCKRPLEDAGQSRPYKRTASHGAAAETGFGSARLLARTQDKENIPPKPKGGARVAAKGQQQRLSFAPLAAPKAPSPQKKRNVGLCGSEGPKPPAREAHPWPTPEGRQPRPSVTLHRTTMDRVQGQQMARPTLGLRRNNFDGWKSRMSRKTH